MACHILFAVLLRISGIGLSCRLRLRSEEHPLVYFYLSVCLSVYVSYIANSRAPSFLLDSLSKYVS